MTVPLFDVQAGFGGATAGTQVVPLEDLTTEMDRLEIGRALVRIAPDNLDGDVIRSNEMLMAATETGRRLVPCPVVLPSGPGDVPPEAEQVANLLARGAGAVCIRPEKDCWTLSEWASGTLFLALQERRVPVMCLHKHVRPEPVASLAAAYSELPLIIAEIGYRQMRTIIPLLESFPNVHLSIGSNLTVHGGLERLVRAVGAERLLFGTGFPEVEAMMAVTMLMYADLGDEERELIGAGNLTRLIGGVRR